ncbi:MAG: preprotein translocase subunit YajC [Actinomycetaceae bacterium]
MEPTFIILIAGMILMFWFMSRQGKKAQARQREQVESALVPGAWIQTIALGYHQVVEINGDVVTLSNPDGTEILVHRTAVRSATQSPYELMADGSHDNLDDEDEGVVDVTPVDDARDAAGEERPAVEQSDDFFDDGRQGRDDRS